MTTNEENEQKLSPGEAEETAAEAPAEEVTVEEAPAEEDEGEKLAKELATVKDQLLRTMAEYDNYRKRTVREKDALRTDIISNVTEKFFSVIESLERALATECSDENYKTGVQMIYDQFMKTLSELGVEEIASDGADFDPRYHQAVQRVDDESVESGKVAKTFAKGYKLGDKIIRFAMVAVAN